MDNRAKRRKKRWLWFVVILIVCVAFAPTVIARTSLRNRVLQYLVGDPNTIVAAESVQFGWASPLEIVGFEMRSIDGNVEITAERIQADKSWLSMLLSRPDLGHIAADHPRIHLVIPSTSSAQDSERTPITSCPTLGIDIRKGDFFIKYEGSQSPVVDVEQVDIGIRTEQRNGASMLIIDPIQLVDRSPVTPSHFERGLQLVAPELITEIGGSGEYSLELSAVEIDLTHQDEESASTVEGVITLHQAEATLKNDMTRRLLLMAAELMNRDEIPDHIRLTDDANLRFKMTPGGVYHDGFAALLPNEFPGLSIRSEGVVGFDESLRLEIRIQIPATLLSDTPLAEEIAVHPLELRMVGKVGDASIQTPADQTWVRMIRERLALPDVLSSDRELGEELLTTLGVDLK